MTTVIESEQYEETRLALMNDPIIRQMAAELPPDFHEDMHAWWFIHGALDEYNRRGGTIPTHIGGPAEAMRRLIEVSN